MRSILFLRARFAFSSVCRRPRSVLRNISETPRHRKHPLITAKSKRMHAYRRLFVLNTATKGAMCLLHARLDVAKSPLTRLARILEYLNGCREKVEYSREYRCYGSLCRCLKSRITLGSDEAISRARSLFKLSGGEERSTVLFSMNEFRDCAGSFRPSQAHLQSRRGKRRRLTSFRQKRKFQEVPARPQEASESGEGSFQRFMPFPIALRPSLHVRARDLHTARRPKLSCYRA